MVTKPGAGTIWSAATSSATASSTSSSPRPTRPAASDQGRGNSGVMIFGRYEIQVLDSYDNLTYADGQAAAIYGQYPPLVNASRKPGQWQTYDIIFTAPRFKADGSVESPGLRHRPAQRRRSSTTTRRIVGPMAYRSLPHYQRPRPQGPDRPPGPRQPRPVPQHLGPRDQGLRPALSPDLTARLGDDPGRGVAAGAPRE